MFLPSTYGLDASNNPADPLGSVLDAAPGLATQPGIVSAVMSTDNPAQSAQVADHAQYLAGMQKALQNVAQRGPTHTGWLGGLLDTITHAPVIGTALQWAAKPLEEVQGDYRYLHSVYVKHGFFAGALATIPAVAGGVLGSFAGPQGAMLGGELATSLTRRLGPQDSQADADNPNYKVSFGRDVANLAGVDSTDHGYGKYVSGIADAIFDLKMDPLLGAGRFTRAAREGTLGTASSTTAKLFNRFTTSPYDMADPALKQWALEHGAATVKADAQRTATGAVRPEDIQITPGAVGSLTARWDSARTFLDKIAPGQKISTADQVGRAFDSPGSRFKRAAEGIARWNGEAVSRYGDGDLARQAAAGRIVQAMPDQQGLAWELATARTAEDVRDTFIKATQDVEMMRRGTIGTLPSRSLARGLMERGNLGLQNVDSTGTLSGTTVQRDAAGNVMYDDAGKALTAVDDAKKMGPLARTVRTFTGYLPYAIDRGTLQLSSKTFDGLDAGALQGVYRTMRYSMGSELARVNTGRMAQAMVTDVAQAKSIWAESQLEMLKAAGLPDDIDLVRNVTNQVRQYVHGGRGTGEAYGYGLENGRNVGEVPIKATGVDGEQFDGTAQMALSLDQRGKFAYPDFGEVKTAMRDLGRVSGAYGKVEDFLANEYINKLFKPLALVTAGFGLRVAAAEALPAALRYGAGNFLRAKVADIAGKRNAKLAAGEDSHVAAAMAYAANGTQKLLGDPQLLDQVGHQILDFDGHIMSGVADSGHNAHVLPEAAEDRQAAIVHELFNRDNGKRIGMSPSDDYRWFHDQGDERYKLNWLTTLQKKSQQTPYQRMAEDHLAVPAGTDVAQHMIPAEADRITRTLNGAGPYNGEERYLSRYHLQSPDEFAAARVDDLRGLVTGADGTVHTDLLEKIARGEKPTFEDVNAIPAESAPTAVIGPDWSPYIGPNIRERLVNEGFKRLVTPVINSLSREPLFTLAVREELRALQPALASGLVDEETARWLAYGRASHAILPQVHNTLLRSQFAEMVRTVVPFYFAQEQAYKRYGHLLGRNPAAFRAFQLINHGLHDPGFVQADANGNRYLNIPLVGELGKGIVGGAAAVGLPVLGAMPMSYSGNLDSLGTVLPEVKMPGTSPLLAIATKGIDHFFPEAAGNLRTITGDAAASSSLLDDLIPNSAMRTTFKALRADANESQFHNAYMTSLAAAHFHGQDVKDGVAYDQWTPAEQQRFLGKVRNDARSLLFGKALLNVLSPLSPKADAGDFAEHVNASLSDEFRVLLRSQKTGGLGLGYQAAMDAFLREHGDKAISYTIAKDDNLLGARYPRSQQALDFLTQHKGLIEDGRYGGAAAFLVPQAAENGNGGFIHDELLKQHLIERRTPDEFFTQVHVAASNRTYYAQKALHDQAVAQQGGPRGATAENAAWTQWLEGFKLANPAWTAQFASPVRQQRAAQLLNGLINLTNDPQAFAPVANSEQAQLTTALLAEWHQHQQQVAQLGNVRAFSAQRKQLRDGWQAHLNALAESTPQLQGAIRSIFLPISEADANYALRNEGVIGG